ncbi:HAD family phosphatase [Desemzia sp. RIT804]|uniref:Cof-type HAD-IIB family hydrolase n=1 Tax=Desemzia sp. RIT 804 TaxID=2810209 RepID=UPI001950D17F|nr:Cof-type HAD-IIB family hydrolase [Desemzia sp. RIT 804]MBM6615919.1 HAD family phosphatase [Desemzia sp. RIT 804]
MIKLIAIDIDGTLLNSQQELTRTVKGAIKEAVETGIKIVFSTGRPWTGIDTYVKQIGLEKEDDFAITLNGALVLKTNTQEDVYSNPLKHEDLAELQQIGENLELTFAYFDKLDYLHTGKANSMIKYDAEVMNMRLIQQEIDLIPFEQLIYKAQYVGDASQIEALIQLIPKELKERYYMVLTAPEVFEILAKGVSKAEALKKLINHLEIDATEVMAIGDGLNDLDMLELVGSPVAMGNAEPEVKKIATYLSKSNEENGVAYAIRKWALEQ